MSFKLAEEAQALGKELVRLMGIGGTGLHGPAPKCQGVRPATEEIGTHCKAAE